MIQDNLKIHIPSTLNMYSQDGTHTDTKISFNPSKLLPLCHPSTKSVQEEKSVLPI